MNPDQQLDALFRAARSEPRPTDRSEFGFETRLLARLRAERANSIFTWAWRLTPYFALLAIWAGIWISRSPQRIETESLILAELSQTREEFQLVAFMTGEQP